MRLRRSSSRPRRSCCCVKRARTRSWRDRTWHFETVNTTSGSRLQARLQKTQMDGTTAHLSSGHQFARKTGMLPCRRPCLEWWHRHCTPRGHRCHGRSTLGHFRGVASAAPREAAVGQCSSARRGWSWSACPSPRQSATPSRTLRFWKRWDRFCGRSIGP